MPTTKQQLATHCAQLDAAWGDSIPAFDEATRTRAQGLVANRTATGTQPVEGSKLPGWTQGVSPDNLVCLASAYRHTRDEAYARAAHGQFAYWLDREVGADGVWRPSSEDILVVPHRLGTRECVGWFGTLPEFLPSPLFDEAFVARIIESARQQLNYQANHLYIARNMRMTQCDCLLTQGLRLAFLPDAAQWRDVGLRGINDALHRQFNPDGSSVEATGWYHYIVMNMAHRYWRLSRAMPEMNLQVTAEQIAPMFDYMAALISPNGQIARIGDSNGMTYDGPLAGVLARRADVRRELGLDPSPPPLSQHFSSAQQSMLRDAWSDRATYITFDATVRSGYHWHPARNAIQLHHNGVPLITDPGRCRYDDTPQRRWVVKTRAHSTLNINGWDQSDADPSYKTWTLDGYDIVQSLYSGGYWPNQANAYGLGLYAQHQRTLIWVRGRFAVVIDHLYNTCESWHKPTVECNWHLGPVRADSPIGSGVRGVEIDEQAGRIVSDHGAARLLMLAALRPVGSKIACHCGATNPHRGWVADDNDEPVPAPWLSVSVDRYEPWTADFATVLVPHVGATAPDVRVESVVQPLDKGYGKIALVWGDGARDLFLWTPRMARALEARENIWSDAGLVHLTLDRAGTLKGGMVFGGSIVEPYMTKARRGHGTFVIA